MRANTRLFGEIDIDDAKIVTLENGMIGLPEYKKFALIFDEEKEQNSASVMWLQSMDDSQTAFPVMRPDIIKPDYNPVVDEELLAQIGEMTGENMYVLVTLTACADIKETSVNLKAPIVINTDTNKGCQIIVEDDYPVKFRIYDAVQARKRTEE